MDDNQDRSAGPVGARSPGVHRDVDGLTSVGIRALRESVSTLVRRAANGERIVITSDGKPLAQLGPLGPAAGSLTLEDLAAAGLVDPPRRPPDRSMPAPYPVPADVRLDRLIDQIRGR